MKFKEQLLEYAQWRDEIARAIETYRVWRERYDQTDALSDATLANLLNALSSESIFLGVAAERSKGKTELINALFYAEMGLDLLPFARSHATVCPTELFYDQGKCYLRLLDIETRLEEHSLMEYKQTPQAWTQIELDCASPLQMQEAFKESRAVKKVSKEHAEVLGLWNQLDASESGLLDEDEVEIPRWRYALISLSLPLLKQGLRILDTPGLKALGGEPELILSLLPSADAVLFVFAAEKGVTKSDLKMWNSYIRKVQGHDHAGLALVMNKTDELWDDSLAEAENERTIVRQVQQSATRLNLDERLIYPVSAQQALIAKAKQDAVLLKKSRLLELEYYLTDNILLPRRNKMQQAVTKEVGLLLNNSLRLSEKKYKQALDQLDEFKEIDCDNAEMMDKLLTETRDRQQSYLMNVESIQSSRQVFSVQATALIDSLSKERVDVVIQRSKEGLTQGLSTYGLKQGIQLLFDDLRDILQEAVAIASETRSLVKVIYKKLGDEYGVKDAEPLLFPIEQYQDEMEQILAEGELFRTSTKTAMTEKAVVLKILYNSIISRVRAEFEQARQDAAQWSKSVLLPLKHEIKDHKKQLESRMHMLRKISGSKQGVAENIAQLELQLVPLIKQFTELQAIISAMKIEGYAEH